MNKRIYGRLAWQNIRRNKSTFFPFLLIGAVMAAVFYMLHSISMQVDNTLFYGAETMCMVLDFGNWVCGIFSVIILLYTNGFLMKQRSKELGLYSLLGMEKKHISRVVFWELVLIGTFSILLGLFGGIIFSKLMFMVLLAMLGLKTDFAFHVSLRSLAVCGGLFVGLYLFLLLMNVWRVYRLKPVELMQESRAGEKEPKAKWLLALIGLVCLAVAYYIAVTTENPIDTLAFFFLAVLCVIAGTYLLFIAGSIALLKFLKKKKGFYYHHKHFITVSGMMYRMKQNAAGLAGICILSTCVLVVLSTTVSLYAGMEDIMRTRFPRNVITEYIYKPVEDEQEKETYSYDYTVVEQKLQNRAEKCHVKMKNVAGYYSYSGWGILEDSRFSLSDDIQVMPENLTDLTVYTLEDYNRLTGSSEELQEGQILLQDTGDSRVAGDSLWLAEKEYQVKRRVDNVPEFGHFVGYDNEYIVVKDVEELLRLRDSMRRPGDGTILAEVYYNYSFDIDGAEEDKESFCKGLRKAITDTGIPHVGAVEDSVTSRTDMFGLYGSLLFIGVFIGMLFLAATVLIIYYKQISEGYEDRERFRILKRVGMSGSEVRQVIKSQILQVFFLPILLAGVHIIFAFPIIRRLLLMLNFANTGLFVACTVATVFVFVLVYAFVYMLTARTYYRISAQQQ